MGEIKIINFCIFSAREMEMMKSLNGILLTLQKNWITSPLGVLE